MINVLMLVPSLYMLQIYDRVLQSRSETTLWMLSGITLGLYTLSFACLSTCAVRLRSVSAPSLT
ncbi:hypothetical protein ACU4GD_14890 [Cupriavidus basilensis]